MKNIHPTAIVDSKAEIDSTAEIGPYCIIEGAVKIGARTKLLSNVIMSGNTTIGEDNTVYPFACLGLPSQDLKHKGKTDGRLVIGNRNTIREHATMHVGGTEADNKETVVGNDGTFLVNIHVAHDCVVGDRVIMSNNATLAGHVKIGDEAIIGGLSAVHQFCRIGRNAMIGGCSGVVKDVIPYALFMGTYDTGGLRGLNLVGLKRKGLEKETIADMVKAYKFIFNKETSTFAERVVQASQEFKNVPQVMDIINFIRMDSNRSFEMPIYSENEMG